MTDSAAAAPDPDMVAAAAFEVAPHPLAVLRLASAGAGAARYDVVAANAAARQWPPAALRGLVAALLGSPRADPHAQVCVDGPVAAGPEPATGGRCWVTASAAEVPTGDWLVTWRPTSADDVARETQLSMDAAAIGMALTGTDGRFRWVNRALCQMLGYRTEELVGRSFADLTHPDDRDLGIEALEQILDGSRDSFSQRKRYRSAGGGYVWIDLYVGVVRSADGSARHMVAQMVDVTAEVHSREALSEATRRYQQLAENASDVVLAVDTSGVVRWASASVRAALGWEPELVVGTRVMSLVADADDARAREAGRLLLDGHRAPDDLVVGFRCARGGLRQMAVKVSMPDDAGFVIGLSDVTEELRAKRALEHSERLFRAAMSDAPTGMGLADRQGRFVRVNAAMAELVGLPADQLLGRTIDEFVPPDQQRWSATLEQLDATAGAPTLHDHALVVGDHRVWIQHAISVLPDNSGHPELFVHQFVNLTATKELHDRLTVQATTDSLTGLLNRAELQARLQFRIEHARAAVAGRAGGVDRGLGVVFCDVDHLKRVNDAHGHLAGDRVLSEVGRRIADALRSSDLVGRFGGDEFVAILAAELDPAALRAAAERIRAAAGQPVICDGRPVAVTVSVGAAVARPEDDSAALLARADAALYRAKDAGRNCVWVDPPIVAG